MKFSKIVLGAALTLAPLVTPANAGWWLHCQGPLTGVGNGGFTWSEFPAGMHPPKRGECAWPDRKERGNEDSITNIQGLGLAPGVLVSFCSAIVPGSPEQFKFA